MKLSAAPSPSRRPRGSTLIEVLCYLAVIGLVISMAMAALFQLIRQTSSLRRNCEEIAAAVKAGETWRADIRQTRADGVSTPESGSNKTLDALVLSSPGRTIVYTVKDGAIWRQAGADAPEEAILRGVKTSRFSAAPRKSVTAWLWEIELKSSDKAGVTKPLFSFTAVPATQGTR